MSRDWFKLIESRVIITVLALYILLLPFAGGTFAEYKVLTYSAMILSFCICMLAGIRIWRESHFSISLADLIIGLFIVYELIQAVIIESNQIDPLVYYEWLVLGGIYLMARMNGMYHFPLLLFAVALSGWLQSVIGILQYFDLFSHTNIEFKATGCFKNPGPWGGYIAISLAAILCLLLMEKSKLRKIGYGIFSLPVFVALFLSDSRAAWLSIFITFLYVCYRSCISIQTSKFRKRVIGLACGLLCVAALAGLYQYKTASADVRLLLWTVSSRMFADAPLCGQGIGSFPREYMEYQAEYFKSYPDSEFISLSDNNTQPFNELMAIACEQGIIGCVFVLTILGLFFCCKECKPLCYLLLPLCVFSFFSYPCDIFPLKVFLPLCLGLCPWKTVVVVPVSRFAAIFALVTFSFFIPYMSSRTEHFYDTAFKQLFKSEPQILLLYNTDYMSRYLRQVFDRKDYSNFIRLAADNKCPFMTSVLACDIGIAYMQIGMDDKAEDVMQRAYWMVPSKVLPKYLLFRLYRDTCRYREAKEKAKEIISMKVTQVGSVYLEARSEAKHFLSETIPKF